MTFELTKSLNNFICSRQVSSHNRFWNDYFHDIWAKTNHSRNEYSLTCELPRSFANCIVPCLLNSKSLPRGLFPRTLSAYYRVHIHYIRDIRAQNITPESNMLMTFQLAQRSQTEYDNNECRASISAPLDPTHFMCKCTKHAIFHWNVVEFKQQITFCRKLCKNLSFFAVQ